NADGVRTAVTCSARARWLEWWQKCPFLAGVSAEKQKTPFHPMLERAVLLFYRMAEVQPVESQAAKPSKRLAAKPEHRTAREFDFLTGEEIKSNFGQNSLHFVIIR